MDKTFCQVMITLKEGEQEPCVWDGHWALGYWTNHGVFADGRIRLATLELSCLLLKQQVLTSSSCIIKDVHLACLEVRPCFLPSLSVLSLS